MANITSYASTQGMSTSNSQTYSVAPTAGNAGIGVFVPDQDVTINNIQVVAENGGVSGSCAVWVTIYDNTTSTQLYSQTSCYITPSNGNPAPVTIWSGSMNLTAGHTYSVQVAGSNAGSNAAIFYADVAAAATNGDNNYLHWYGSNSSAGTVTGTAFRMSVSVVQPNQPPNAPTSVNFTGSGSTINQRPHLPFNSTDPDGNTITDFEVQLATDSAFSNLIADDTWGAYGSARFSPSLPVSSGSNITYLNPNVNPVGTVYVRARAYDGQAWGNWSSTYAFTVASAPWNDTPNGNGLKAQWMNDLATVINNARAFRGLSAFTFTDGTLQAGMNGTDMRAVHVTDRRTALTDVLGVVGVTPTWTNPAVSSSSDRSGQDVIDLRNYCAQT